MRASALRDHLPRPLDLLQADLSQASGSPRVVPAVVCVAAVPHGGQPSNRKLLDGVKNVLGTL